MFRKSLFILFTSLSFNFFAQKNALDSLSKLLSTVSGTQKVFVLNDLASELKFNNPDTAFRLAQKAFDLSEQLHFKEGIAKSAQMIGIIYENQDKHHESIEHFILSLKLYEELGKQKEVAIACTNVGIIYAETNLPDSARYYMNRALTINKQLKNNPGISAALLNLGGSYEVEKEWDKALQFYNEALAIGRSSSDWKNVAKCLSNIGYVYYVKKDYSKAEKALFESVDISRQTQSMTTVLANYEVLADLYSQTKNFEKAFQYHKLYSSLKDTLQNKANTKQLAELQARYQADKKQKQIELLNKEKENQALLTKEKNKQNTILLFSALAVVILTLIFSFFLFQRFKLTRAQKKLIEEKNREITDSIKYAKRIQGSVLPTEKYIERILNKNPGH
jgi:tetratricopeptide (TPR) repeat protein